MDDSSVTMKLYTDTIDTMTSMVDKLDGELYVFHAKIYVIITTSGSLGLLADSE